MKDYTPIELLDIVLEFLYTSPNALYPLSNEDIAKFLKPKVGLLDVDIAKITRKLLDEKLVDYYESVEGDIKTVCYTISFEGKILCQEGGYMVKLNDVAYQRRLIRNSYWVAFVVAVGSGIAGVYYLIEIVKTFYPSWFPKS